MTLPIRSLMTLALGLVGAGLATAQGPASPSGGVLRIVSPDGEPVGPTACPLKYTDVQADIAGFVGRVSVKQVFHNPTDRKIEAVYVFPLPQDAAVDDMLMVVGDRVIRGEIHEREEAREIYDQAVAAGHVASLLDQERPNIFTQSVANIEPGVEVTIEISFVETLKYEEGVFEWVFPMVVGPRYIPGGGSAPAPMTEGRPTPQVPDADRITPPVTLKGTRAGHDISIKVSLDAGMEIHDLTSVLHDIDTTDDGPGRATVTLTNKTEIPNRDFVLKYRLATDDIGDTFLLHEDERGRFFTLILQPPQRVTPEEIVPRELVFVLDTSGSMSGFPMDKSKELMRRMIETMHPSDTFNIVTFAGSTSILWDQPQPATRENIRAAREFVDTLKGRGGTEMMKAINVALEKAETDEHSIRVVCFLTDGYVGNDMAIVDAIKKNAGTTRVFSFGIGNSVNRFLMDGMARAGRGEAEYVTLETQGDAAVDRFHERLLAPVLTDIEIDWGDLPVTDVYPRQIPDLFAVKPIMVHGRLTTRTGGTITLRGYAGDGPYEDSINIAWLGEDAKRAALPSLWARAKVEALMMTDYAAAQRDEFPEETKKQVIDLGITYRLMTQYTSFVAVEEMIVTAGGEPVKVNVPVEMPAGVSYEGVFGAEAFEWSMQRGAMAKGRRGGSRGRMPYHAGVQAKPPASPRPSTNIFGNSNQTREEVADTVADGEVHKMPAELRLAESLRNLAAKVEAEGRDGNLTVGKLKVVNHRVDVMIFLGDLSDDTLAKLKELGFVKTGESKAVKLLIGSIDVRKLLKLAELDAVVRVKPVVQP